MQIMDRVAQVCDMSVCTYRQSKQCDSILKPPERFSIVYFVQLRPRTCCNICPQMEANKPAKADTPGLGGGDRRSAGGGCCIPCPSRYYGAQNYGAPPFSEPGNREQNIVAGTRKGLYRPDGVHPRVAGLTSNSFNMNPKQFDPQGVLSP